MAFPGLPPTGGGLVKLVAFSETARLLPSRCQTSGFAMLLLGQRIALAD